jgi:hypothetical protein
MTRSSAPSPWGNRVNWDERGTCTLSITLFASEHGKSDRVDRMPYAWTSLTSGIIIFQTVFHNVFRWTLMYVCRCSSRDHVL